MILIGLGVVFLTLGILTFSTYLMGWLINKYFRETDDDEGARVAAVVAALHSREVH